MKPLQKKTSVRFNKEFFVGRADGQIPGKKEEKKYKSVKPHAPYVSRKEMGNGDFIRHRGRPGNGKERPDGQVQGAAEKNAVQRAHPSGQLPQILPGKTDSQHRSKRQNKKMPV